MLYSSRNSLYFFHRTLFYLDESIRKVAILLVYLVCVTLRSKSEECISILKIRAPSWSKKGMLLKTPALSQKWKNSLFFRNGKFLLPFSLLFCYSKHKSRVIKIFYHSSPLWASPQHLLRYCPRRPLMVQFAKLPIFYVAFAVRGLHR